MADPVSIAARIAGSLEKLGVRYVLGGSLASTTFGEPRTTLDVDLAVDLRAENVDRFVDDVQADFFLDREWARSEVQRCGSFQAVHKDSMVRVDLFVPEWTGFDLWKWENRQRIVVERSAPDGIDVTNPEAIILQKLLWYHAGGDTSERQWRDVVGVLKAQSSLDTEAMEAWSRRLGIHDLLERARAQSR